MTQFTVLKKELLPALLQMKKVEGAAKKKQSTLEVTITNNQIQLVIPGIQLTVNATTKNSGKFTMRLWYFIDVVKSEADASLVFTVIENQLKLRGLTFNVLTTFFNDDSILRSIDLPINYTYLDVAKLYFSNKFTTDEIIFNNLDAEIIEAIKKIDNDISKAETILRKYSITKEQIELLVNANLTK